MSIFYNNSEVFMKMFFWFFFISFAGLIYCHRQFKKVLEQRDFFIKRAEEFYEQRELYREGYSETLAMVTEVLKKVEEKSKNEKRTI